jgi:hypothetical protein
MTGLDADSLASRLDEAAGQPEGGLQGGGGLKQHIDQPDYKNPGV